MKLVVWKIGEWKPSKYDEALNLVVVFKGIHDSNSGETYKLNLSSRLPNKDNWLRVLVEGNVVDVDVMPGTKNINKFGRFTVMNKAKGKEAVDEEGELPGQLELI